MEIENKFSVSLSGETISMSGLPEGGSMTREDALNLAAWLVVTADETGAARFGELLKEVFDRKVVKELKGNSTKKTE